MAEIRQNELSESFEEIPSMTPLQAAQQDLAERCSLFCRMVNEWRKTSVEDVVGRARLEGMMEMAADEIERRRREYARQGLRVYVVHSRGGAPIRVDKNCKMEMWE